MKIQRTYMLHGRNNLNKKEAFASHSNKIQCRGINVDNEKKYKVKS